MARDIRRPIRPTAEDRQLRRYFVAIQVPVIDLRPLVRSCPDRLPKPTWPDPEVGTEFVRSVGTVQSRPSGPVYGWDGEPAFCDASRLVRFGREPSDGQASISTRYRRMFASDLFYRFDAGFVVHARHNEPITAIHLAHTLTQVPVVVGAEATSLAGSGPALAQAIHRATSEHAAADELPHSGRPLRPAVPMVLVESNRPCPPKLIPMRGLLERGARIPVNVIEASVGEHRHLRPLRGALWRLHTELETLRAVNRAWMQRPDEFDGERLLDYLDTATGALVRNRRDGVLQPPLIAIAESLDAFDMSELSLLADHVGKRSKGLARRVQLFSERARDASAVVATGATGINIERLVVTKVSNQFEFNAPASGVFGSQERVEGNQFVAAGGAALPAEVLNELLRLVGGLPDQDESAIQTIQGELVDANADKGLMRSALERVAALARGVGTSALPLLEAVEKAKGLVS